MSCKRSVLVLVAIVTLGVASLVQTTEAHAECSPTLFCSMFLDVDDLPDCLEYGESRTKINNTCEFEVLVVNNCEEALDLVFLCEDDEEHCPDDQTLQPGDETELILGPITGDGDDGDIQIAIDDGDGGEITESEAIGTVIRVAQVDEDPCDEDEREDDDESGCTTAPGAPSDSAVLAFLLLVGGLLFRRGSK